MSKNKRLRLRSQLMKESLHYKSDSFNLQRNNQNIGTLIIGMEWQMPIQTDFVLSVINSHESFKNIWIGESGDIP
jgi:hypothetical protein